MLDSACFSPDGTKVFTIADGSLGQIIDVFQEKFVASKLKLGAFAKLAYFSPDSSKIVTSGCCVCIWDASTGSELGQIASKNPLSSAQFSPDGTKIIVTENGRALHTALIADGTSGKTLHSVIHTCTVNYAQFSPDGTKIVSTSIDGSAKVSDATTGINIFNVEHRNASTWHKGEPEIYVVAKFSADSTKMVTALQDGFIRIFDTSSGEILQLIPHEGYVNSINFNPDQNSTNYSDWQDSKNN